MTKRNLNRNLIDIKKKKKRMKKNKKEEEEDKMNRENKIKTFHDLRSIKHH
jgi:hypothetical protein